MPDRPVERLQSQEPAEKHEITTSDVKKWLKKNEPSFMAALQAFARKTDTGFQEIVSSKGWEDLFKNKPYIPDLWKKPTSPSSGEFTAAGLCAIASGVIEKVLRERFGGKIEVKVMFVITSDMDIETERDTEERPVYPHHIIRFRVQGGEWYTIDAAYKQFQLKVKPHKMLITPTKNEPKLYNYNDWYTRMRDKDPENAWKYLPQERERGSLEKMHLEDITKGKYENITIYDYMKLVDSFRLKNY